MDDPSGRFVIAHDNFSASCLLRAGIEASRTFFLRMILNNNSTVVRSSENAPFETLSIQSLRVHIDRTLGRHRHHWSVGRVAATRSSNGSGSITADELPKQPETDCTGDAELRIGNQAIASGLDQASVDR